MYDMFQKGFLYGLQKTASPISEDLLKQAYDGMTKESAEDFLSKLINWYNGLSWDGALAQLGGWGGKGLTQPGSTANKFFSGMHTIGKNVSGAPPVVPSFASPIANKAVGGVGQVMSKAYAPVAAFGIADPLSKGLYPKVNLDSMNPYRQQFLTDFDRNHSERMQKGIRNLGTLLLTPAIGAGMAAAPALTFGGTMAAGLGAGVFEGMRNEGQ